MEAYDNLPNSLDHIQMPEKNSLLLESSGSLAWSLSPCVLRLIVWVHMGQPGAWVYRGDPRAWSHRDHPDAWVHGGQTHTEVGLESEFTRTSLVPGSIRMGLALSPQRSA